MIIREKEITVKPYGYDSGIRFFSTIGTKIKRWCSLQIHNETFIGYILVCILIWPIIIWVCIMYESVDDYNKAKEEVVRNITDR